MASAQISSSKLGSMNPLTGLLEKKSSVEFILSEEVTFLNKGGILDALQQSKHKSIVIDASRTKSIDIDVLESLQEFKFNAEHEGRQQITFINL